MEKRKQEFQRNVKLESLLQEINSDLRPAEQQLLENTEGQPYPVVLVMGALRSGTTLLTQWLANTQQFAYPTNVMSRFYEAPVLGAKIQRLLFDPVYNFRNEIMDAAPEIRYHSQNGKTIGALSPNEFWYFWRRFFPYDSSGIDYLPDGELKKRADTETFVKELMGIAAVFDKPVMLKGMIANYNIGFLNEILDRVVFVHIKREPCANISSILEARQQQYGNEDTWYSFHIPEMKDLQRLKDPAMQAAGQVYYNNLAISSALQSVSVERKLEVSYEDFCGCPEKYYTELSLKLESQGYAIAKTYEGPERFDITRKEIRPDIKKSYQNFMQMIGQ
ncbi:MAG: sulfotransferase [Clostridiaceae bacterium]|nr:sulfotransferase [Clostridiaceae bacterium]